MTYADEQFSLVDECNCTAVSKNILFSPLNLIEFAPIPIIFYLLYITLSSYDRSKIVFLLPFSRTVQILLVVIRITRPRCLARCGAGKLSSRRMHERI